MLRYRDDIRDKPGTCTYHNPGVAYGMNHDLSSLQTPCYALLYGQGTGVLFTSRANLVVQLAQFFYVNWRAFSSHGLKALVSIYKGPADIHCIYLSLLHALFNGRATPSAMHSPCNNSHTIPRRSPVRSAFSQNQRRY